MNSGNFSGSITGAGGLTKTSGGTLTLSGNSTFAGGTTVSAGTLLVNGSLNELSSLTVEASGTLGGNGTVGAINLNGGTLSSGNSPGALTAEDLLWSSGGILFELGPDPSSSDGIRTGSLVGLGSSYAFTFVDQGMVTHTAYDLITFEGSPTIPLGNFTFTNSGGFNGSFSYSSDALNATSTLHFTAIPEPSTWAFLLLAARRTRSPREAGSGTPPV